MPMYMDIHEVSGATAADVAKAHIADVKTQGKYGVVYHKYWLNESNGKIFCLCSAPNPEAAASVHRAAPSAAPGDAAQPAEEVVALRLPFRALVEQPVDLGGVALAVEL